MLIITHPKVRSFIDSSDKQTRAKIYKMVYLLELYGQNIGMPYSKKINQVLYELRIRGKPEIRILYAILDQAYLLHAFIKQTQKLPKKDLKTGMARFKNLD